MRKYEEWICRYYASHADIPSGEQDGALVGKIIRCKDCKYYQHGKYADDWLWCMMNHHYTDEEKYCAWAERKEE